MEFGREMSCIIPQNTFNPMEFGRKMFKHFNGKTQFKEILFLVRFNCNDSNRCVLNANLNAYNSLLSYFLFFVFISRVRIDNF